jgi:hypothetical protein
MNNLKYGLVGNTIFYGGVWGFIGYLGKLPII